MEKVDPFNMHLENSDFGGSKILKFRLLSYNKKQRPRFWLLFVKYLIFIGNIIQSGGQVVAHGFFLPRLKIIFWSILT
jgi:hypothetical protein